MTTNRPTQPPADLIDQLRVQFEPALLRSPEVVDTAAMPVTVDIVARDNGVLAGVPWLDAVFKQGDPAAQVEPLLDDGTRITANTSVACVTATPGLFDQALSVGLAYLQAGSATAGLAQDYVKRVQGTGAMIRATGTTLPGFETLTRYALAIGGADWPGEQARHLTPIDFAARGGVAAAVESTRPGMPDAGPVYAVVETLETLEASLEAGVDGVLLTDMPSHVLTRAVNMADAHRRRFRSRLAIEATGMVTLRSVREMADTGVDAIRVPDLTLRLVGPAFRALSVQPEV